MDIPLDVQTKIDEAEAELIELRYDRQFIGDFKARASHDGIIERREDYIRSLKNPYIPRTVSVMPVSTYSPESRVDKAKRVAVVVQRALKQEKEGRI